MRIAIVADWLTVIGGAEQVIRELLHLYPHAHLLTTVAKEHVMSDFLEHPIQTTRLQLLYRILNTHQILLPFFPRIIENIDVHAYDIVLSSSHAIAKGIIPPVRARHITYCHTPMRYAWEMEEEYLQDFNVPPILKPLVRHILKRLRRWDLTSAKRIDTFIANSSTTAERIKRIYNRDSVIVHPPVDERFFQKNFKSQHPNSKTYFLAVGRLVPYKKFDLLVEAANILKLPLKIVGEGREKKRLQKAAGPTVQFLGHVNEEELPSLYQGARALLFPVFEDAGVVPLEAQACGTPVIAYGRGGVRDTVVNGKTGLLFAEQTIPSLGDALTKFEHMRFDPVHIQNHARGFSAQKFRERIDHIVQSSHASRSKIAQRR